MASNCFCRSLIRLLSCWTIFILITSAGLQATQGQEQDSVPALKLQPAQPASQIELLPLNAPKATEKEDQQEEKAKTEEPLEPTHKQIKTIRPSLIVDEESETGEEPSPAEARVGGDLQTFCLAYDGTILAGLSRGENYAVQMLSPDGEVQRQVDLTFEPQVITQAPNGTIFVAGPGKLAKLSSSGEVLTSVDAPWLGEPEQLKKEIKEEMQKQYSDIVDNLQSNLDQIDARIEKLESELEENPSDRTEKRLEALKKQRKTQVEQIEVFKKQLDEDFDVAGMMAHRLSSTGIAANSEDLFVCASGRGFRYEVWRMDHDFGAPEKVVGKLSGCCGQCDIQCDEENLIVAANTEFAVQFRTRDGETVSKFGKRGGQNGFGSCCNPMNVRVLPSGDILTAESSIGWIKRFSRDGDLLGVIGKAKIGGGCKHVPIGYNENLDRYYMQYEDRHEICVLDPIASITGLTEDEQAAKEAREGLGTKLVGKWKNSGGKKRSPGVLLRLIGGGESDSRSLESMLPSTMEFFDNGNMTSQGGQFGMSGDAKWNAVRQLNNTLVVERLDESETGFNFEIEFQSDDEAIFKLMMDTHEFGRATFKKITNASKTEEQEDASQAEAEENPATTTRSFSITLEKAEAVPPADPDDEK